MRVCVDISIPNTHRDSRYTFAPSRRDAPAVSCAMIVVERTRVTTSTPESPGIPARNGFNGFLRALVSAKSARMCERAVVPQPPVAGSEPVRARRPESLTGSKGQIRCLPQPEQLHGLRARTEQGRELDDGTKRSRCRRYRRGQGQGGCVHSLVVSTADVPKHRGGTAVSGSRI